MDKEKRLLAVATGGIYYGGVCIWRLDTFEKIGEQQIGWTKDVRFNTSGTKLIAVTHEGSVFEISLE